MVIVEMGINYDRYHAFNISSYAEFESIETYEGNIKSYENWGFSYIPLPFEGKYYDVDEGELKEMSEKQWITEDYSINEAIELLQSLPFVIFSSHRSRYYEATDTELRVVRSPDEETEILKPREVASRYPEHKQELYEREKDRPIYDMITLADLNKRHAKEMFYSIIAEVESGLSDLIEKEFPESTELFKEVSPRTIGRWQKAGLNDVQMHIAEYMTLAEIQKVVAKSDEIRSECGFSSRNKFDEHMSGIVDLRHKVMHSSRTLVHNKKDVKKLVGRLERLEKLLERLGKPIKESTGVHTVET